MTVLIIVEISVGEKGLAQVMQNWWVNSINLHTLLSLRADMCYWMILLCHWHCVVLFFDMIVNVKWGKEKFDAVELNTEEPPMVFKAQLFALTGVQPERQKVMVKGGTLKVLDVNRNWKQ